MPTINVAQGYYCIRFGPTTRDTNDIDKNTFEIMIRDNEQIREYDKFQKNQGEIREFHKFDNISGENQGT